MKGVCVKKQDTQKTVQENNIPSSPITQAGNSPEKPVGTQIFDSRQTADADLMSDIRTTILIQNPKGGRIIVWLTMLLLIIVIVWMSYSEVDEITRGNGKVIPSSHVQMVQNFEGGILAEIHVSEGDIVQKGQILMRLDETRFSAPLQESRMKYLAYEAKSARLIAETEGGEIEIPGFVITEQPEIAQREVQLFLSRRHELNTKLEILKEQIIQRKQDLTELIEKNRELKRTYALLKKEVDLTEPLVSQGAVSEVEFLRLQRQASSMQGEMAAVRLSIPRVKSKLKEAEKVVDEEILKYSNQAKQKLNEVEIELEGLSAVSTALEDRLDRTSVKSPVYGTVKQIFVNTVGGAVQPGMDLVEIVPLEDTLRVEAQIKPSDIAFLRDQQKAVVKFTAYDFTIYGGLDAKLEHISADSITDPQGNSFYVVRVRTDKNFLEGKNGQLPIIPGMVTSVDIVTGKKTILSYLLKPVLRAKNLALRER